MSSFDSLVKLVNDQNFYINSTPDKKEDYTLHCFRHSVAECSIDLYKASLKVIIEFDYKLDSNEFFMFEFLITRTLNKIETVENALFILNDFLSNDLFNYKENIFVNFEMEIVSTVEHLLSQVKDSKFRKEDNFKTLNIILLNPIILNLVLSRQDNIKQDIYNISELSEVKKILNISNFD